MGPGAVELCRLKAGSALLHRKTVQSLHPHGTFHNLCPILIYLLDSLDIFCYSEFECGTF